MGQTVINLDSEVKRIIHVPSLKDVPLYTRNDGGMDEDLSGSKTAEWIAKSKKTYSSPHNVRMVCIAHDCVYMELYKPVKGSSNASLSRKGSMSVDMAVPMSRMSIGDKDCRVKKTGIGALVHPWVLSNLEEVYWDWSIFLSEDIMNMGYGDLCTKYVMQIQQGNVNAGIQLKIFKDICCKGIDITKRFPRLRAVGYIGNLSEVLKQYRQPKGGRRVLNMQSLWGQNKLVQQAMQGNKYNVSVATIKPNRVRKESVTTPGIYLYDAEVLDGYFRGIAGKIEEEEKAKRKAARESAESGADSSSEKTETQKKGKIETLLDSINSEHGKMEAGKMLSIALTGANKQEKKNIIDSLTEEGRKAYT